MNLHRALIVASIAGFGAILVAHAGGTPQALRATIRGELRSSTGEPAAGVRIAAIAVGDSSGSQLIAGLAQTDARGRYLLEDLPPGKYLIGAGALASPVYHPGVASAAAATVVAVIEGSAVSGMDFTIVRTSFNVTGRVTSDGPALSAARLTIAGPSGGERGPAAARSRVVGVGPDGAFEVRDLPAGRYTVSLVQAAGTRGGQTAIPVTPVTFDVTGRDLTLDLRATPPGPGSTLDSLLDSLQRAANSLQRASSDNKGGFREKAMAEVDQALRDAQAARVFLNDHRDAANEAAVPRAVTPSFMPAGGEGGHPNMFDALRALQDSFETLRQIKGGDLGGNRSRLNSGIAAAAQSVIAGIDVARGIQQATAIAATTPSSLPGKTPLDRTLDALRMAAQSLQRATSNNKGGNREKAIASIEVAIRDVEAARAFLADRPALAELAPAPIAVKPDFGFPQNEVARHTNLNDAFNALRMAFDELSRAPGGDLGGHRSKASASIAATVGSIIDAVRVANGLP